MHSSSISRFVSAIAVASALGLALVAGQAFAAGSIVVGPSFARATAPGQPSAGAYISIENKGKVADTLKSVSTTVAKSAELHAMKMDGDVMKMREVDSIDLKPAEKIVMQPSGGYHIMLIGLNKPLKSGDHFPMTLTFAKAGKVNIDVAVEAMGSNGPGPADKAAAHMQH